MSDIAFEAIEAEIKSFLASYPVTWIGRRPADWEQAKFGQVRQDFSDAIVKCGRLMDRLRVVGPLHKNYAELLKKLLETKNALRHEFEKYEMWGLGEKGTPRPQFGIYSKPSRRPPERVPEHLKED